MHSDDLPEVTIKSPLSPSLNNKRRKKTNIHHKETQQTMEIDDERQTGTNLVEDSASDHEDVGNLVQSVDTLRVTDKLTVPVKTQTKELLHNFIQELAEYDTTFLRQYLDILQNKDRTAITDVSNNIISGAEQVVSNESVSQYTWREADLVVILGWLTVSVLTLTDPHIKPSFRVFGQLLKHATMKVRVRLATACWRHLTVEQLIELADVASGLQRNRQTGTGVREEGADTTLTDLLLRSALCRLQSTDMEPKWDMRQLTGEEVMELVSSAWSTASAVSRSLLTRITMRARAAGLLTTLPDALKATSKTTGASSQPETIQVLIDKSKLGLLFHEDKIVVEKPRTRGRPRTNVSN